MELKRRNLAVFGLLAAVWALVLGWQVVGHLREREAARQALLISHAKDISNTLGVVIRSQRWRGGVIKERIETALDSLVNPEDLNAIALLNDAGEVIASAGQFAPPDGQTDTTITLTNLVALGTNAYSELEQTNPTIVVPLSEITNRFAQSHPPAPAATNELNDTNISAASAPVSTTNAEPAHPHPHGDRWRLPRPSWMSEDEYKAVLQKEGVHSFALVLSTKAWQAACEHDLWMRGIIALLATISVIGFGLAWNNVGKSAELQIRLVRASEMNTRLKEMNVAAAGLAHETRNPLNIIRGLAHMIAKQTVLPQETRDNSRAILDETDKVTAQLTEFINYSRPREVRRSALPLSSIISEVARALNHDLEERRIKFESSGDSFSIEADEQMFRQILFNLIINAIQAVPDGGKIQVVASRLSSTEASLDVRDNGPGVPVAQRNEIFTPYFTTRVKGTGLGLAVVHQIVMAHGWEIQCLPNEPTGAVFRISHLKLVN